MKIEMLKTFIESESVPDETFVFVYKDVDFLPMQYVTNIAKQKNRRIEYVESLDSFQYTDIFGESTQDSSYQYVFKTDKIEGRVPNTNNLIIVCKEANCLGCEVVDFQNPENWQIIDYVVSVCTGVSADDLKWLVAQCKYNLTKIQNEIDKLLIFDEKQRQFLFNSCKEENMFSDVSDMNIFSFTEALKNRDVTTLVNIYKQLQVCDVEPLGVVTILYKDIKRAIQVKLRKNPTIENTGCKSTAQLYAINKSYSTFSREQLINIFKMICSIDFKLKDGTLPSEYILDYVVTKMLSM